MAGIAAVVLAPINPGIAAIAAAASAVANVGAQLTAKRPPAQGSTTRTTIGTDQPSPYLVGRTLYAGARVWLTGYGATLNKVKNPYLLAVDVHSVGGPVDALESVTADMSGVGFTGTLSSGAATGYFVGHLWRAAQLGAMPEAGALAPHWTGSPGWTSSSALSGKAAIAWSALFDKDGNVFASGFSPMGAVWRGVKCYDPRLDSTYPGGSGPHRWADPANTAAFDAARATWTWSEDPGLHALRYALGSWERDTRVTGSTYRRVFGAGIPIDGLIVADFVTLANVCDANGWTVGGVLLEPASSKWDNLKRLLQAGGAEPAWRGGRLGIKVTAPRVALDTITARDLADAEVVVGAMGGWEQRLNTLLPKYRSEDHRWEYVVTAAPVQIASYLSEDGEEKREERQLDLVQDATQATQLCAYELMDRRELGEIEISCKPRMRRYGPGDLLIVDLPEAGLSSQPAVVLTRSLDPATLAVRLTLRGETTAKHAFALGLTGTAPPTPQLVATADMDAGAGTVVELVAEAATTAEWPSVTNPDGTKPSDNAGTSGTATPLGSHVTIEGNTIRKIAGTDGVEQGAAVWAPLKGTAFISCGLLWDATSHAGGYSTVVSLDTSATAFTTAATTASAAFAATSAYGGTLYLVLGGTTVTSVAVSGLTLASRLLLRYEGNRFVASIGAFETAQPAPSGLLLYPKVNPYELTTATEQLGIVDVQVGPWSDKAAPKVTGNPSFAIDADYLGAVTTTLPLDRQFSAFEGETDVTTSTSWAISDVKPSSAASGIVVNNSTAKGKVTLSSGDVVSATLTATLPGGATVVTALNVAKTNAAAPSAGGAGASSATITALNPTSSTSFADAGAEVVVRSDGAGKLRFAFDIAASGSTTTSATRTAGVKLVYATTAGGSPTDIVGEQTAAYIPADDFGQISYGETQLSMPAPSTDYYFRPQARKASGTGNVTFPSVLISVRQ